MKTVKNWLQSISLVLTEQNYSEGSPRILHICPWICVERLNSPPNISQFLHCLTCLGLVFARLQCFDPDRSNEQKSGIITTKQSAENENNSFILVTWISYVMLFPGCTVSKQQFGIIFCLLQSIHWDVIWPHFGPILHPVLWACYCLDTPNYPPAVCFHYDNMIFNYGSV